MRAVFCVAAAWLLFAEPAFAGVIFDNGESVLRWDNTIGYETAVRVENRNPDVLRDINADDADRNFAPGIVSNRFDLVSDLDYSHGGFGFDASASAWYDFVYHQKNHNDSPATFNPYSVPHNEFPAGVKSLQGGWAELDNAFLFGNAEISGLPVSFRIGRYTLLWGESLFFPETGIAGAQAPVDENRVIGRPSAYAREVTMPVTQASASIQLPGGFSFEAYDQFEWRRTRIPGAGAFLSTADYLDTGGERYLLPNGQYLLRAPDRTASSSGQFGAALRWTDGSLDLGLYALRFNARDPEVIIRPGTVTALNAIATNDPRGLAGTYRLVFPEGIGLYGASASFALGNTDIAGEISGRTNMPIGTLPLIQYPGADVNALYPTGSTLNGQVSSVSEFGRSAIWDSANLQVELAGTVPVAGSYTHSNSTSAVRALFQPGWFEVLPEMNLTLSMGLGLSFGTYSGSPGYNQSGAGDFELGATATYRVFWNASLVFSHFLGSPYRQPLADRDFITFRIQRTF